MTDGARPGSLVLAAGICEIVSGLMGLVGGAVVATIGIVGSSAIQLADEPAARELSWLPALLFGGLGLVVLVLAAVAVVGGIAALRDGSFGLLLVGAVASLVVFPPLGIAALALILVDESDRRTPTRPT